jgi:hypothetical protein
MVMSDEQVSDARAVEITFSNGSTRRFAYEPLVVDPSMLASTFQKFIDQGYINFEMEDRLLIIPMANVQSLEVTPRPEGNLPNSFKVIHEFD